MIASSSLFLVLLVVAVLVALVVMWRVTYRPMLERLSLGFASGTIILGVGPMVFGRTIDPSAFLIAAAVALGLVVLADAVRGQKRTPSQSARQHESTAS